ncbi:related to 5`-3` DNA helicase [Phialocephala subalpina]|uniref:ATP-dependent DNA helicase n=1 Tax=Phialocephala subalpina TaxID=576137 RepID=A0A1L7X6M2_9HELO|nr:related to 5`-3` DNA helicase [Phialocephala subalpina]
MASTQRAAAYVVYRGRKPGVHYTLEQCEEQTIDYPKGKYLGFNSSYAAEKAWVDWERKLAVKHGASTFLQQVAAAPKPKGEPVFSYEPPHVVSYPALPAQGNVPFVSSPRSENTPPFEASPHYITPPSSSPPRFVPDLKRSASYIDFSDSFGSQSKRPKMEEFKMEEMPALTREERFELGNLEQQKAPGKALVEEPKIELSPEQEKVVNLALRKSNIFLTGAAGSGKTVTLKEILRRIRKRRKGGSVQVVAPTGISALPLGGKTTYSFAGWNPDSMRTGIEELLKKKGKGVIKAIHDLDVLIIEEISMVENQFLERLNRLFKNVLANNLPFGGKQVIFLGDFHQLPPVRPFSNCLQCGCDIPAKKEVPKCISTECKRLDDLDKAAGNEVPSFQWSDKWAFKSSVWKELGLRHIKLEQIHRQKDARFQDILNKIRNGLPLTAEEWTDLERPKEVPNGAFAVRLMSRLNQVKSFNANELAALTSPPRTWTACDTVEKLINSSDGVPYPPGQDKVREYTDSLRDHRFPAELTLKVGARVVLLYNLDHDKGLVNGSQGVVIGFGPAPRELVPADQLPGSHKDIRTRAMMQFQAINASSQMRRPVVRFANGVTQLIPAFAQDGLRGNPLNKIEQYVATRTQVPLALAWALSIHKSQGMTLEYVEVSSRDIFESGQLYVALSRATHLDPGLRLTGFKRNQLPMDPDVLQFYNETRWEKLEPRKKKT